MAAPFGWGLIGASYIAQTWVLPAIRGNAGSEAIAVVSRSRSRGERFAQRNDIPVVHASVDDLLADERVDAVYISTTNELHAELTIAAAGAGKHVLCEKPLALTLDDGQEMIAACRRAGVVLATNHNKRHAPTHRTMRRLLREGAIGQLFAARVFFSTYLPRHQQGWRIKGPGPGGGVVLDLSVHDADLLRFIIDDDIGSVIAMTAGRGMADAGIEDCVMGVFRFRGGVTAIFHDSFVLPAASNGLELHGSDGSIVGSGVMGDTPAGQVWLRTAADVREIDVGPREDLFSQAVANFVSAVRDGAELAASGEDGLWSLAVALACLESAQTGHAVSVISPVEARLGAELRASGPGAPGTA